MLGRRNVASRLKRACGWWIRWCIRGFAESSEGGFGGCAWPAHPSPFPWPTTGTRGSTSKVANSPATGPLSWKPTSPRSRRACTVAYHTRQMGRVSMSRASQGVAPCFRRRPRHQAVVPPSPTSSSNRWSKCAPAHFFYHLPFLDHPLHGSPNLLPPRADFMSPRETISRATKSRR